jgi:hypothetical protein
MPPKRGISGGVYSGDLELHLHVADDEATAGQTKPVTRRRWGAQQRVEIDNKKPRLAGVGAFYYWVPGSDLLSHTNAYYHRRDFVSRPCSGWEGVGPKRYDRQA